MARSDFRSGTPRRSCDRWALKSAGCATTASTICFPSATWPRSSPRKRHCSNIRASLNTLPGSRSRSDNRAEPLRLDTMIRRGDNWADRQGQSRTGSIAEGPSHFFATRIRCLQMPAEKLFDPYHLWLGIAPEHQPPNHYLLLGIGLFEHDDEVIEQAAERQSAHIRTFLSTPQAAQAKSLLNKIRLATDCLQSPELKARYDAALKTQLAGRAVTTAEDSAAVNPAAERSVAQGINRRPRPNQARHRRRSGQQRRSDRPSPNMLRIRSNPPGGSASRLRSTTPWALIVGGVLMGVLALGGAAAWLNRGGSFCRKRAAGSTPTLAARRPARNFDRARFEFQSAGKRWPRASRERFRQLNRSAPNYPRRNYALTTSKFLLRQASNSMAKTNMLISVIRRN